MKTTSFTRRYNLWLTSLVFVLMTMLTAVVPVQSVAAATSPCAKAVPKYASRCDRVLSLVHRGGTLDNSVTIEDTLTDFRQANRAGNDGVEADIWPLKENGTNASSNVEAY